MSAAPGDGVAQRGLARVEARQSRATRRTVSPRSPSAPRRARGLRGAVVQRLLCGVGCAAAAFGRGDMPRLSQFETTNAGNQSVSHRQVEHAPEDVDRRR